MGPQPTRQQHTWVDQTLPGTMRLPSGLPANSGIAEVSKPGILAAAANALAVEILKQIRDGISLMNEQLSQTNEQLGRVEQGLVDLGQSPILD